MDEAIAKVLETFDTDTDGSISCNPLVAFAVVPYGGGEGVITRLEYAQEHEAEPAAVQLVMMMPGAFELLGSLGRTLQLAMTNRDVQQAADRQITPDQASAK